MNFLSNKGWFYLLFICWSVPALSQFNIKVGYNGAILKAPSLNNMITLYNNDLTTKYDELDKFTSLHGLEIGVRYRIGNAGFEASWNSINSSTDVFGVINGSNFSKKYWLSMTEYALHAESYYNYFGIGAGLGYRTARMKTDIPGSRRKKQELDVSSGYNGKLYLIFQIPGDNVALVLKPYVQIPFSKLQFEGFAEQLGLNPIPDSNDDFRVFGLSILLYNGKQ
jgi:hypothetical protein